MLPYNLISIRGQGNPSIRQVWVCLQGFPLHDSERLSPGPCYTLCTGTALSSRLTSCSAALEPTRLPPVPGALHVPASLLSTDPGMAPLPSEASATHTGQSSSTSLLLSCSFFFFPSRLHPDLMLQYWFASMSPAIGMSAVWDGRLCVFKPLLCPAV